MCSVENKAEDRDILSQENMRLLARSRALVTAGIPEHPGTGMLWGRHSASWGCAQCAPGDTGNGLRCVLSARLQTESSPHPQSVGKACHCGNSHVGRGHGTNGQVGPCQIIISKYKGEGLGLSVTWSASRACRVGSQEARSSGTSPQQPRPAPSLTSSLLTSMFHTAIPPSEEQETSCLVS